MKSVQVYEGDGIDRVCTTLVLGTQVDVLRLLRSQVTNAKCILFDDAGDSAMNLAKEMVGINRTNILSQCPLIKEGAQIALGHVSVGSKRGETIRLLLSIISIVEHITECAL